MKIMFYIVCILCILVSVTLLRAIKKIKDCENGEWVAGENPVSLDHGPVKIDGVPANKAVKQDMSLICGRDHLTTWVWADGCIIGHFFAVEDDEFHRQVTNGGNYWFVREVNDSVKLAHRDMGFRVLEKYTKFPK